MRYILFLLLTFCFGVSFGQKRGIYYVSVSTDSMPAVRLRFLSDSTVELGTIPRHMIPSVTKVYKYTATRSTIEILPDSLIKQKELPGLDLQAPYFKEKTRLTKINRGYIDYSRSIIYVRDNDFPRNPDITYIINGRSYIQDMGVTDGYGLIRRMPKTNRALDRKLKTFNKDNCKVELVRGLKAYQRFGINKVYGVIVVTSKKVK